MGYNSNTFPMVRNDQEEQYEALRKIKATNFKHQNMNVGRNFGVDGSLYDNKFVSGQKHVINKSEFTIGP